MKRPVKNKRIPVQMVIDAEEGPLVAIGIAIITNDEHGKTLSLCYGSRQMTISFEQIEQYLK